MTLYVIGFIVVFLLIMASGFPVGFGLGFLALGMLTAYTGFDMALETGVEKAYASLDSSVLVAIPLFVLAAQLVSASGMGKRLFDAARVFLGRMSGSLGSATIVSSGVFSAMTGSSFVSASTMGLVAIPELRKARYSDTMIAAAITAGGSLGSIIPPSIVMIIYAYLTDESIGKLFMAGMVPGILLVVMYCVALAVLNARGVAARKAAVAEGVPGVAIEDEVVPEPLGKIEALKQGFWGLMAPVVILGGIYLGIFTASEAAAIAVVYCAVIGLFVYRTLNLRSLWDSVLSAASISAMIVIVVIGGALLGYVVVFGRIPQQLIELIIAQNFPPMLLLLLINLFLFVLGMFLESLALMYLAIPLLYPVVQYMGWDNTWFAVLMLINVNLGLITPPMGGVLFVVSHIGDIPFHTVIKGALVPISILVLLLVLLVMFPTLATWLPSMM